MSRPNQIRRIIAELRRALGPDVPAWQLLRMADLIVQAYREPEVVDFDEGIERSPFYARDVARAFDDGGWKVLDHEVKQGLSLSDDLPDHRLRTEAKLRNLLGRTSWPRTETD